MFTKKMAKKQAAAYLRRVFIPRKWDRNLPVPTCSRPGCRSATGTLVVSDMVSIRDTGRCGFCNALMRMRPELRKQVEAAVAAGRLVCFSKEAYDLLRRIRVVVP